MLARVNYGTLTYRDRGKGRVPGERRLLGTTSQGRLDEIFVVDPPDLETQCEIFVINLGRRRLDLQSLDLVQLAETSESFFREPEIEQATIPGLMMPIPPTRHGRCHIYLLNSNARGRRRLGWRKNGGAALMSH